MKSPAKRPMNAANDGSLQGLFDHALKDIYYAEKKIYKTLPKMIKAAVDPDLKTALDAHREETAGQIERLEQVFELLGQRPKAVKCDAIDGILDEGDELLEDFGGKQAGDAAIIFACQAVEHYEITRYGSMHAYATELGMNEISSLLEQTLAQEKDADKALSKIAMTRVNYAAEAA